MMRTSEPLPPITLSPSGPSNVNGLCRLLAAQRANKPAHCHPIATLWVPRSRKFATNRNLILRFLFVGGAVHEGVHEGVHDGGGDASVDGCVDALWTGQSPRKRRIFALFDLPLLCAWAETVALRERMATRMAVEGELDEKGKPSGAFTIHKEATKTLNALALRLRISPQARMQKAPKRQMRPVSYYERLELEGVLDDDDNAGRDQRG
jgi:hypothetical protein